jgi:hypothetical protein
MTAAAAVASVHVTVIITVIISFDDPHVDHP